MNAFQPPSEPKKACMVHDHLQQAAKIMCENDCGTVPVLDTEGQIVGMITALDICIAAYRQCKPLWHMDVASIMSKTEASALNGGLPKEPARWAFPFSVGLFAPIRS
jgi:predicted transcriptional regulator